MLIGLVVLLSGGLIVLVVFLWMKNQEKKKLKITDTNGVEIKERPVDVLSDVAEQKAAFREIKKAAIIDYGYLPEVAAAIAGQAAHETGRYKSDLAVKYNNLFGMKSGGGGGGIQSGEKSGFATYDSMEDSLKDLDLWLTAKGFNKSEPMQPENYLQWIKSKRYFEDTLQNYKTSVLSLINELN